MSLSVASGATKNDLAAAVDDENSRKAEYAFLEALRQRENDSIDAFFELLRYAHRLDPDNSVVAYYLGFCYVTSNKPSRELAEQGYNLMKRRFDIKPTDYDESLVFASVAGSLGHNDVAISTLDTLVTLFPDKLEVRSLLADAYARNRNFDKAIATYDTLEILDGKSLAVSLRKINYYMALNDTAGTINEGRELFLSAPNNGTYNLLLGNIYMQIGRRDSALKYIDRAQRLDPENGMTYLTKAQIYYNEGDSVNYDKQIYQALVSKDLDVENKVAVLTDYIQQLLAERDSSQRVDNLFQVLISQHTHEKAIHELYAKYLVALQKYDKAAEQMEYVTDIDPSNAASWVQLMMLNFITQNDSKAIYAAQKALEYNPDNLELYVDIAPVYYQMKEYDKAIDTYNKALEMVDSVDFQIRSSLVGGMADAYYSRGDTAQAFQCYEEALKLDPTNSLVMNNYAYFLAVSNTDLDRAERLSALAVKADPENPTVVDTYAWVFFRKKEYKLALAYIEKAIKNSEEENAEILEHYGDILFMNGQFEQAVENWEKALKLNPDSEILERKVKYKTYFNE